MAPRETDKTRKLRAVQNKADMEKQRAANAVKKTQEQNTSESPSQPEPQPSPQPEQSSPSPSTQQPSSQPEFTQQLAPPGSGPAMDPLPSKPQSQATPSPEQNAPFVENPNTIPPVDPAAPVASTAAQIPLISTNEDEATRELVRKAMNLQSQLTQKFHLQFTLDAGKSQFFEFDTLDELIEKVQGLKGKVYSMSAYWGQRLKISKAPNRYISTPYGPFPLFKTPTNDGLEFDEDGVIGESRSNFDAAPSKAAETEPAVFAETAKVGETAEDEYDDEDDTPPGDA